MVDDGYIVPIAEEIAHEGLVDLEAIERQPALFERLAQDLLEGHPLGRPAGHLGGEGLRASGCGHHRRCTRRWWVEKWRGAPARVLASRFIMQVL
jgi:hypothetical protein